MIGPKPTARQQLLDDQLLDALGRGLEPPAGSDELATGLAAWRSDLAARPITLDLAAVLPPAAAPLRHRFRWRRLIAGAGAALAVASGGGAVAVAAASAGPDSPLWPITQLVHPDRAEARLALVAAQEVVADARAATAQGRYADAERLLGEAEQLVPQLPEGGDRRQLVAELARLRSLLPVDPLAGGLPPPADRVPPAAERPPAGDQGFPLPEPGTDPAAPRPPLPGEPAAGPDPEPAPPPDPDPEPALPVPPLPSPLPSLPSLPP